jgi:hypothetical protein
MAMATKAAREAGIDWTHPHDPDAKITKMKKDGGPTCPQKPSMPSISRPEPSSE